MTSLKTAVDSFNVLIDNTIIISPIPKYCILKLLQQQYKLAFNQFCKSVVLSSSEGSFVLITFTTVDPVLCVSLHVISL